MLEIDGSHGEGGGQILRTAVALSAVTGIPCRITNIRANRPSPGLKPQHLMGIKAAAEICSADTKGVHSGSTWIEFIPHDISGGEYTIEIGTAGSITLILQVLTPICLFSNEPVKLTITGGTDVKWSPSMAYFEKVFCSILEKMNAHVQVNVNKYGFYPKGGGRVTAVIHPWSQKSGLNLTERGPVKTLEVVSIASSFLENARVAERQYEAFEKGVSGHVVGNARYVDTLNPGSSLCGVAFCEYSVLGADSLGERGKPAETVGREVAGFLQEEIDSKAALDVHMGDQIVPYLALAGGKVTVSQISNHTRTSIWVCQQFVDTRFTIEETKVTAVREGGQGSNFSGH
ncbi:MAG: RNA 3'-terminal phosphate cyclase [Theionarchaea archaeon]|nr:RNA 3'-terminal phosphate cyclase [Theionarchaea archaeon]